MPERPYHSNASSTQPPDLTAPIFEHFLQLTTNVVELVASRPSPIASLLPFPGTAHWPVIAAESPDHRLPYADSCIDPSEHLAVHAPPCLSCL